MKAVLKLIFIAFMTLFLADCTPDMGAGEGIGEQNLVIALDPDPGTTIAKALGTTYDFKVLVKSTMPPRGVEMRVVYKQDSDGTVVFTRNYTTSVSPQNVTITDIPFNEVGTVTVTVTSKSRTSNTATKTFKLARK